MSTLTGLISRGGGGGGNDNTASSSGISRAKDGYIITTSQDLVMPTALKVKVIAIGGGGGGGAFWGAAGSATGGGAGGLCVKTFNVSENEVLSIVIGSGSGGSGANNTTTLYTGGTGGTTTVTNEDSSVILTANGGSGGSAVAHTGTILGGAGGTASGGDLNYTGGRGGTISDSSLARASVTGGGAVNFFGTGNCNGGDITVDTLVNYNATGAGSPFSSGSSITTAVTAASYARTGGGGFGAPSDNSEAGGSAFIVNLGIPHANAFSTEFLYSTTPSSTLNIGSGVVALYNTGSNTQAGFMGGAGASVGTSYTRGCNGGAFGGGGATVCGGNQYAVRGGGGAYGGGGGAVGTAASGTSYYSSNNGGGAGAVIVLFEEIL